MINGRLSAWLYLQRGCRQGDPLSPYLFIQDPEIQAFSQKVVIKILIIVIEVFFKTIKRLSCNKLIFLSLLYI